MHVSINLDGQSNFRTVEINNEWSNSMLAAKFHPNDLLLAKAEPQMIFCRCHLFPKLSPSVNRFLIASNCSTHETLYPT